MPTLPESVNKAAQNIKKKTNLHQGKRITTTPFPHGFHTKRAGLSSDGPALFAFKFVQS